MSRFGPRAGAETQTKYGVYKRSTTQKTRKWNGMHPDENFGKAPSRTNSVLDHTPYTGNDGKIHCMSCKEAHGSKTKNKDSQQPEFSGRRMARGDEWRYSELKKKPPKGAMRTNMISTEAPEFMTRIGTPVPNVDFGHQHPFAEGSHTVKIRNASVQKGCAKKCTWQTSHTVSSDSPFAPDSTESRSKSKYGKPYAGSGHNGEPKKGHSSRVPEINPPFAVSVLQHPNDFNKSSTRHNLGKQNTNRFYNAVGGWSASRA